jgi:hypothetical protein
VSGRHPYLHFVCPITQRSPGLDLEEKPQVRALSVCRQLPRPKTEIRRRRPSREEASPPPETTASGLTTEHPASTLAQLLPKWSPGRPDDDTTHNHRQCDGLAFGTVTLLAPAPIDVVPALDQVVVGATAHRPWWPTRGVPRTPPRGSRVDGVSLGSGESSAPSKWVATQGPHELRSAGTLLGRGLLYPTGPSGPGLRTLNARGVDGVVLQ